MNFLLDFANSTDREEFSSSKKDILKFLKIIGVDTRFVSIMENKIYINNLRFSKFSRRREAIFYKQYPEIKIIRSSLFMKICSKTSKVLTNEITPGNVLLMDKENIFLEIILEPYTRKYGITIEYNPLKDYDFKISPLILDDEVNNIFSDIFSGLAIDFKRMSSKCIYPLITTPKEWIISFCKDEDIRFNNDSKNNLASSFMNFLEDINPQYRENVIKSRNYLEKNKKS